MPLSDRGVKTLKPKSSVYRIRESGNDPELKGFGVTIAPAGSKSFFSRQGMRVLRSITRLKRPETTRIPLKPPETTLKPPETTLILYSRRKALLPL